MRNWETYELLSGKKPVSHELPGSYGNCLVRHGWEDGKVRRVREKVKLRTQTIGGTRRWRKQTLIYNSRVSVKLQTSWAGPGA